MAGVDVSIVREYFEMNGFFVRQLRKYNTQKRRSKTRRTEDEIDLLVMNPRPQKTTQELNFMLFANDLPYVSRAILSVKGWHTTRFTPAMLKSSSDIFKFLERDVLKRAEELFSIPHDEEEGDSFMKILVLPGLPTQEPHRSQSIRLLRMHGVDAIISFRAMLQDIISKVEINHNYEKSDFLQVMRLLKNYEMLRDPQMELFGKLPPKK